MTQEIRDRATAGAGGADSRTAELEAALRERTKEQKLSARQLQLAESRLEQVERERDELLDQISGLEADIETSRATVPSAEEVERERERHAAELETAKQQLEAARDDATVRLRETEELRTRLRSLEGRDAERETLLGQVAALEEELTVLRKQNRDLEELVLNANTEVQRSRKQADDLWQKITGGHPPVAPAGPDSESDGPVPSNDDSPDQEGVQIRGGDLSQLVDGAGELEPTQTRPPVELTETGDGTVDPREMMKDTAELVGDDPIEVPEELREVTVAEQQRRSAAEAEASSGGPEVESPDQSRLMAILSGEGTVDGDAPWESERGGGRLADPSFTEAPTRVNRPLTGAAGPPLEEPVDRDTSEHVSHGGEETRTGGTGGEAVAEDVVLEEATVEEELDEQEEEVALPPPVEFLEEPAAMAVAAEPEPVPDEPEEEERDSRSTASGRTLGIEDLDRQEEFQRLLLDGARFHRTDRFGKVDLVNRIDIQISDWLASSDDLDGINEVSGGRMAKARLLEVLWVFFQRRMFRLEEI